jgi:MraZ protein
MTQFVGTHFGKLDRKKGRISVPAAFRSELEAAGVNQIAFRVSHQYPCIEARSRAEFERMVAAIRSLDTYSEEREAWEAGFISVTEMLRFDVEGRLLLPEHMVEEVGLPEAIAFLGKSDRFEIWEAEAGRAHVAEQRAAMREKRFRLPSLPLNTTPRGVS